MADSGYDVNKYKFQHRRKAAEYDSLLRPGEKDENVYRHPSSSTEDEFLSVPVRDIKKDAKFRRIWNHLHGINDDQVHSGEDYEKHCAMLLQQRGYTSILFTDVTGDFGADLIAISPDGIKTCFQCKYYTGTVPISAVQEVIGARSYYGCQRAIVATNAQCTKPAHELAEINGVEIWEGFF